MATVDSIKRSGEPVELLEPDDVSPDAIQHVVLTTPDGSFYVVSSTGSVEEMEGVIPVEDANREFDIA